VVCVSASILFFITELAYNYDKVLKSLCQGQLMKALVGGAFSLAAVIGGVEAARAQWTDLEFPGGTVRVSATVFRGLTPDVAGFDQIKRDLDQVYRLPLQGAIERNALQAQLDAIYDLGWFRSVEIRLEPTEREGEYVLVYHVLPNPIIERVELVGVRMPPLEFAKNLFGDFPRGLLNNRELDKKIVFLQDWYQQRGYSLAEVKERSFVDSTLYLTVVEGEIADIDFQFFNDQGERISGRTKLDTILRELSLLPGMVYNITLARQDEVRLSGLDIFTNVRSQILPYDRDRYLIRYFLTERRSRSFNIGANFSAGVGPGVNLSFRDINFGGGRETIGLNLSYSGGDNIFGDFEYVNPWFGRNPYRLGARFSASYGFTGANAFDGGFFIPTARGGRPILNRIESGLSFPFFLGRNWVVIPSLKLSRIQVLSSRTGGAVSKDILGNPYTASGNSSEVNAAVGIRFVRDTRDANFLATSGSLLDVSFRQSLGFDRVTYGRFVLDGAYYLPTGWRYQDRSAALALGASIGLNYGNLPPYDAFILGGSDTLRGWSYGSVATARHYALGSMEFRVPLPLNLYGVAFVEGASALGSQSQVQGNPGELRGKPGAGLSYGLGLRFLNQRIGFDWALNERGRSQISFTSNFRF
jgi:outer membrane protein insertion porin family